MHVNKVSYVFTINHVAQMLGEDEETLEAIAETMTPEDGCLLCGICGTRNQSLYQVRH